jgi:sortase A
MRAGDEITATTAQGKFQYIVEDVRRSGDPLPAVLSAGSGQLTLITSTSGGWRSVWSAKQTVYVDAILKGKAALAPSGANSHRPADKLQSGDRSQLVVLVLWMQLLLVAAIALVWAVARWGKTQAWLIGLPIMLGALWGTTSCAWQLLPNLF